MAAVVNYDIAALHRYGLTYRTNDVKRPIEKFRTYLGRYITYPQIQPYSKLNTDYKIFIIRNNKMYELEKGSKELTFQIKEEVTNVDLNIFTDKFYISKSNMKNLATMKMNLFIQLQKLNKLSFFFF